MGTAPEAPQPIRLADRLASFEDTWSPRTVTTFNGHDVMVVKVQGEFSWHRHEDTDDLFLVLSGRLTIRLPEGEVHLEAGDLFVVPKGVDHQPVAAQEAHLLLIEPTGTPNTGDAATRGTPHRRARPTAPRYAVRTATRIGAPPSGRLTTMPTGRGRLRRRRPRCRGAGPVGPRSA